MELAKTTNEIRVLLINANLDFETVENKALNNYLPKIFHSCPFIEDISQLPIYRRYLHNKTMRRMQNIHKNTWSLNSENQNILLGNALCFCCIYYLAL